MEVSLFPIWNQKKKSLNAGQLAFFSGQWKDGNQVSVPRNHPQSPSWRAANWHASPERFNFSGENWPKESQAFWKTTHPESRFTFWVEVSFLNFHNNIWEDINRFSWLTFHWGCEQAPCRHAKKTMQLSKRPTAHGKSSPNAYLVVNVGVLLFCWTPLQQGFMSMPII